MLLSRDSNTSSSPALPSARQKGSNRSFDVVDERKVILKKNAHTKPIQNNETEERSYNQKDSNKQNSPNCVSIVIDSSSQASQQFVRQVNQKRKSLFMQFQKLTNSQVTRQRSKQKKTSYLTVRSKDSSVRGYQQNYKQSKVDIIFSNSNISDQIWESSMRHDDLQVNYQLPEKSFTRKLESSDVVQVKEPELQIPRINRNLLGKYNVQNTDRIMEDSEENCESMTSRIFTQKHTVSTGNPTPGSTNSTNFRQGAYYEDFDQVKEQEEGQSGQCFVIIQSPPVEENKPQSYRANVNNVIDMDEVSQRFKTSKSQLTLSTKRQLGLNFRKQFIPSSNKLFSPTSKKQFSPSPSHNPNCRKQSSPASRKQFIPGSKKDFQQISRKQLSPTSTRKLLNLSSFSKKSIYQQKIEQSRRRLKQALAQSIYKYPEQLGFTMHFTQSSIISRSAMKPKLDKTQQFREQMLEKINLYRFINRLQYRVQKYLAFENNENILQELLSQMVRKKCYLLLNAEIELDSITTSQKQFLQQDRMLFVEIVQAYINKESLQPYWKQIKQQFHRVSFLCFPFNHTLLQFLNATLPELQFRLHSIQTLLQKRIRSEETLLFQLRLKLLKYLYYDLYKLNMTEHRPHNIRQTPFNKQRRLTKIIEMSQWNDKIPFHEMLQQFQFLKQDLTHHSYE